jgi:hypothetical protein
LTFNHNSIPLDSASIFEFFESSFSSSVLN